MNIPIRVPNSVQHFLLLCALLFDTTGRSAISPQHPSTRAITPEAINVGMVALLANPDKFEGKLVRTHGFLCVEFEDDAVYLHEEDYRYGLAKNSLALRLSKEQREKFKPLSRKYVVIEGVVYAEGLEQVSEWSGAIGNIRRLEAWPTDRNAGPRK